jgi:hypothetical protein
MTRRRLFLASAAAVVLLVTGTMSVAQAHGRTDLGAVRSATASFHSIAVAERDGYALLTDTSGIACIDMPGMGGMGVHWAKPDLVADGQVQARHPEALVYAPNRDGTLILAAVEYVVLKADWDGAHRRPPALFGHTFDVTSAPNRFGLPAYYSLHAWVWQHNPAGRFTMWNPRVTCPASPALASHQHVDPAAGSDLQDMLDLNALKRQLAALRREDGA